MSQSAAVKSRSELSIEERREREWTDTVRASTDVTAKWTYLLSAVGVFCFLVGAVLGSLIEPTKVNYWLKFMASVVPGIIGAIILSNTIPSLLTRAKLTRAEYLKVKADAQYLAEILAEKVGLSSGVPPQRWCRWLGPVHEVYSRRDETYLQRFFSEAREIEILTPNLMEIAEYALKSLADNKNTRVRMMSLHPECSAVYRRYNDMKGMPRELGFDSRKSYSGKIRDALNELHEARKHDNLEWEIRTYTAFPVIMVFRADERFLLGFPLVGSRVREQFHLELVLTGNAERDVLKGPDFEAMNKDQVLASRIRQNLLTHFEKIWETARPYVDRQHLFKTVSAVTLDPGVRADCETVGITRRGTVGDLLEWACSPLLFQDWRRSMGGDCSHVLIKLSDLITGSVTAAATELSPLCEEFYLQLNLATGIARALSTVALAAIEVSCLNTTTGGNGWSTALADELSQSIAKKTLEFEDLAEAVYFVRHNCVTVNERHLWKAAWETIEQYAEHWAR